ncbi:helix-turn-helix domain-containing protein, partial [Nostoc sp. CHAB 5715]|uniref:helix-turn-helix domain-containing protein n=1 Tax=Nostoc sp. CHAB 5715 TaxID=2780400 RepID=UPI001E5DA395
VERTRKQFCCENLEATLKEKKRPGKPRKLTNFAEAYLIATTLKSFPKVKNPSTVLPALTPEAVKLFLPGMDAMHRLGAMNCTMLLILNEEVDLAIASKDELYLNITQIG